MSKVTRTCLIEERKRRQWSQQELADHLGTTRNNVGRWELGKTIPGPYFRAKLCEIFGKSSQELGLLPDHMTENLQPDDMSPLDPSRPLSFAPDSGLPIWYVPYLRNPFFTGRDDILNHLHTVLHHEDSAISGQSCTLSGLGGIGKTQTAIEYAYRYANNYAVVFWISAETAESIILSFVTLANLLDLPEKQEQEQHRVVTAVTRWLNAHSQWLLIFDNVEEIELVKRFLPPARHGSLLFTSRRQAPGISAEIRSLEKMTPEEGVRFLLHRARWLNPAVSLDQLAPQDEAAAREIIAAMDGLPLALDQAGAYIEETQCSLEDYRQRYHQHRSWLLNRRGQNNQDHPASVETALSLSFRQIRERNPAAAGVLQLCAFFAPDAIPEEFITVGCSQPDKPLHTLAADPLLLDEAIAVLGAHSLVHRDATTKTLHLHRLVQVVLQDSLSRPEQEEWTRLAITTINLVFPAVGHATWDQCERLVPHAFQCAKHTASWEESNEELATLLFKTGSYLTERAQYAEAEPLLQKALHIRELALGTGHLLVAEALNTLGKLYCLQGKYTNAEQVIKRALRIRELKLDAEHPDVAHSLNILGMLYVDQGKYAQAEPILERALQIRDLALGTGHPIVANTLINLGIVYSTQGKYAQAEQVWQRALKIGEQALGAEHPMVAYPLNSLGDQYREQGKYAQAEPVLQRALKIWEQALGTEHPQVAHPLNNLGMLYLAQERFAEAESFLTKALQIRELALDAGHPHIAETLNSLGCLYLALERFAEAESFLTKALQIRELAPDSDHPDIASTIYGLATLAYKQNRYEEAKTLYERAWRIREQKLGPNHLLTAEALDGLTSLLQKHENT